MSQLTSHAKKTYAGLMIGNVLIIFSIMLLGQYFDYVTKKPIASPAMIHKMVKFIHFLKENPEKSWSGQLAKTRLPWTQLSLSKTPSYADNALMSVKPTIIYQLLKQVKKVQVSVLIKDEAWLNINMLPPIPNQTGIWLSLASLFVVLLGVLFLINYWAVKLLNQPIQTLIQSLKYSENQANWLPIPVTGNTDQTLIFEKINHLQAKVSQLLDNRTRVITAISHDLRTPLTRLKLRAEYLVDSPHYEKMMHDINDMELMIRETLDYFKELNQHEKTQRFDLVAMLSSLCEDAVDLNFDVHFMTDVDKLIYSGYVGLLKRMFSNLINNAVYYGKTAQVALHQTERGIEIAIDDCGPGLAEDDLERVFLPFYRAEHSRSRETGGTGLGLTIALEIIQKHRGTIALSNRTQGGLRVLVILP